MQKRIWGAQRISNLEIINETIHQLDLGKDSKILDVGTGQGVMAISLALNGHYVLTGDPEEHAKYEKEQADFERHEERAQLFRLEGSRKSGWCEAQDQISAFQRRMTPLS